MDRWRVPEELEQRATVDVEHAKRRPRGALAVGDEEPLHPPDGSPPTHLGLPPGIPSGIEALAGRLDLFSRLWDHGSVRRDVIGDEERDEADLLALHAALRRLV
jgi:hypothetical protein